MAHPLLHGGDASPGIRQIPGKGAAQVMRRDRRRCRHAGCSTRTKLTDRERSERLASILHIQLLGQFHVVYGESPLTTLNTPRLQSLFAYLVLHRSAAVLRRHLAFLIWPDSPEAQAYTNLRKFLFALRQALPDADRFLLIDHQTVQWRPDALFTLDAADFEEALAQAAQAERAGNAARARTALEQAVDLYRGELAPACYDDWILPVRERLQQAFLQAIAHLTRLLEQAGAYRTAIAYAQPALRHDPLNEETYQTLMRLYALSGDRVGVLRTYQTCSAVLQRELGLPPSRGSYEAYERWSVQPPATSPATLSAAFGPAPSAPTSAPLPVHLTSFVGRGRELAAVKRALTQTRLLTLTGPGGSGKTRLAHQVAGELITGEQYQDGVWWVSLAQVMDPASVPQALATGLGIGEVPGRTLMQLLRSFLQTRQGLLILDNCEHLVAVCAALCEELLHACPHLQILATSQEALNVGGELIWPVPPLSVPAAQAPAPSDAPPDGGPHAEPSSLEPSGLLRAESARLFVERATAALPSFTLTHANTAVIAQICQRLDGLPLAIELAAARVRVLSVEQIAQRLDDRFQLLTGGRRASPARHTTLQATIDWSYHLLAAPEKRLFQRLSVFAGTFTVEAVEQVCAGQGLDAGEILDLLARLADRSLVVVETAQQGVVRYRLLETIRYYGRDRLREADEVEPIQRQHAAFFLALAETAEPNLRGHGQVAWLNRLDLEFDNLRAALTWAVDAAHAEPALRLASCLSTFWTLRSRISEGRLWLSRALALPASPSSDPWYTVAVARAAELAFWQGDLAIGRALAEEAVARARGVDDTCALASTLRILGVICHRQGDYAEGYALATESVQQARACADAWILGAALAVLGMLTTFQGDLEKAAVHLEEASRHLRAVGDRFMLPLGFLALIAQTRGDLAQAQALLAENLAITQEIGARWLEAYPRNGLGDIARLRGEYAQAHAYYTEALALYREQGEQRHAPSVMHNLGHVALAQGDYATARTLLVESLTLQQAQANEPGIAECVTGLAALAAAHGKPCEAARWLGAVSAWYARAGVPMWPTEQVEFERQVAAARAQIEAQAFDLAWQAGQTLMLAQAVDEALRAGAGPPT